MSAGLVLLTLLAIFSLIISIMFGLHFLIEYLVNRNMKKTDRFYINPIGFPRFNTKEIVGYKYIPEKDREYVWYFADTNQIRVYSKFVHNELISVYGLIDTDVYLGEL